MTKIDLRAYEETHQNEETPDFEKVALKALNAYNKIEKKFFEDDLSKVNPETPSVVVWIYHNEDDTYATEIELDGDADNMFIGEDVNRMIERALECVPSVGRTRVQPATVEDYMDCGLLGTLRVFKS